MIHTKPDSKGKEAVLFRCRQLTEFTWTPLRDVPVFTKKTGKTKLAAGVEQRGMVYSSAEPNDKFITENVSFETMLSVIANPDSALYHKDLNGHNNSWSYFGIVCNGLARYAYNIRGRYPTKRWPDIPGMRKIADEGCYSASQVELCDVLYAFGKGRSHVAVITDILRDDNGEICQIEVSEAVRPTCLRAQYDLDTFFENYKLFALWRYDYVDDVPMPDEVQAACLAKGVPARPTLAVDCGNKSNYRVNEDVVISTFEDGENVLVICRGGEVLETVTVQGRGKIIRNFEQGYYTIRHVSTGETVEFCVTIPRISHCVDSGKITIQADPQDPDSKILYMEFREESKGVSGKPVETDGDNDLVPYYSPNCASLVKKEELTEEEKKTGVFTREIPADAVNFKVYFQNKYGVWTHTMIRI